MKAEVKGMVAGVVAGVLLHAPQLGAGTQTWTGTNGTDWENALNWNTTTPVNNDSVLFTGSPTPNQPVLTANFVRESPPDPNRQLNTLTFASAGWTIGGAYRLDVGTAINSSGAGTNTISCNMKSWWATATVNAGNTLEFLNANLQTWNGLTKSGVGTMRFSGTSTFTDLRMQQGLLELNTTANSAEQLRVTGGTVRWLNSEVMGDTAQMTISGTNSLMDLNGHNEKLYYVGFGDYGPVNGARVITNGGQLSLNWMGTVSVQQATGVTPTLEGKLSFGTSNNWWYAKKGTTANGIDLDVSAQILDANSALDFNRDANANETGTIRFTAANTYTSGTHVHYGKLLVSNTTGSGTGTGNVTVFSGATLGGTGAISPGANKLTVNAGGILSPGESVGTLTVNGSVDFQNNAVYLLDANGTTPTSDLVVVTGDLKLGTSATIKLGSWIGDPTGDTFTLFQYGTLSGGPTTWMIDTSGTGWTWDSTAVNTSGGFVRVSGLIPEPTMLTLLGLSAAGLVLRRRR